MIRRFLLAFFVLFILCGAVYAQEMEYSGSFITQAGAGLPNTHHNKGDFLMGQTSFDSTFKVYIEESMLYINTILLYDALEGQSSNGASAFVSDNNDFALHL